MHTNLLSLEIHNIIYENRVHYFLYCSIQNSCENMLKTINTVIIV